MLEISVSKLEVKSFLARQGKYLNMMFLLINVSLAYMSALNELNTIKFLKFFIELWLPFDLFMYKKWFRVRIYQHKVNK